MWRSTTRIGKTRTPLRRPPVPKRARLSASDIATGSAEPYATGDGEGDADMGVPEALADASSPLVPSQVPQQQQQSWEELAARIKSGPERLSREESEAQRLRLEGVDDSEMYNGSLPACSTPILAIGILHRRGVAVREAPGVRYFDYEAKQKDLAINSLLAMFLIVNPIYCSILLMVRASKTQHNEDAVANRM